MTAEKQSTPTEPTVLDWFKSLLRGQPIPIPEVELEQSVESEDPALRADKEASTALEVAATAPSILWFERLSLTAVRFPAALILALVAQFGLEMRPGSVVIPVLLFALAAGLALWAFWSYDVSIPLPAETQNRDWRITVRIPYASAGLAFALLTLLASGGNQFRTSATIFWILAFFCLLAAFWQGDISLDRLRRKLLDPFQAQHFRMSFEGWHLLLLGSLLLAAYFRFSQLDTVPFEMTSDHAEKLFDVMDVLDGQRPIFFLRNTGREAMQFYLAAATATIAGTGISYLTLKLGTALAGFLTLPFIYLFAKEIGGRWTGLLAMTFAGIAYWPNVLSRVGLRFPLYPLFAAPAMYLLVRGLRERRPNLLLLSGVAVGLSLHGYSPARALPLVIALGFALYIVHIRKQIDGRAASSAFIALTLVSLIVTLPLLRVLIDMPEPVLYRSLSRMGTIEAPYPDSPFRILIANLWKALLMFSWDDGVIWLVAIQRRPLLDWIMAGGMHLGALLVLVRYLRQRDWRDAYVLLSIPILLLPSVLALAFPIENPAPNRASATMIPVFTLAALPFAGLLQWGERAIQVRRASLVSGIALALLIWVSALTNHNLVFNIYNSQHRRGTLNVSEAAAVVRGFADSVGSFESAYVIPFPHWFDTRLVGIEAGIPRRDFALRVEELDTVLPQPRPLLFLVKPEDEAALDRLRVLFPEAVISRYDSAFEGRDFMIVHVPAPPGIRAEIEPPS